MRRHYGIVQLPVVSDGVLTGVIRLGLLLSALEEEDTRQMLNVSGVAGDSRENTLVSSISTRPPWLTVNLGTTFLAAAAISLFESTLAQIVILASFLPVVAGQGGIGGTQTLTMIVLSLLASLYLLVNFGWMFTTNPDRYFLTLPLLAALHVFAGIAAAGVQLTIQTLALKSAPGGSATPYVGIAGMATGLGAGIGPVVGGALADFFSVRAFRIDLSWSSPSGTLELPALTLTGFDFLFPIAFILGLLSLVKGGGIVDHCGGRKVYHLA